MSDKVLVAMSGGVDSAVAAALLVDAGWDVLGVTFRTRCYSEAEQDERKSVPCCGLDAIEDVRRVCDRLGIRHHVLDVAEEFERTVVDAFCDDYLRGWTPNPCVDCNGHIKFGRLLTLARSLGRTYLATGHYARVAVRAGVRGRHAILRARDRERDQSYVLWPLGQDALASVVFPLGELTKEEVRAVARAKSLPVADKEASQEICFVAHDYRTFIAKRVAERGAERAGEGPAAVAGLEAGPIVDAEGRQVGRHQGFANYTIGQRKGLPALGRPRYVVALDPHTRAVRLGDDGELWQRELTIERVNWVGGAPDVVGDFAADVQIRSRHRAAPATVEVVRDDALHVTFDESQRAPTPGQSAVIYRGDEVVCGGIVTRVGPAPVRSARAQASSPSTAASMT